MIWNNSFIILLKTRLLQHPRDVLSINVFVGSIVQFWKRFEHPLRRCCGLLKAFFMTSSEVLKKTSRRPRCPWRGFANVYLNCTIDPTNILILRTSCKRWSGFVLNKIVDKQPLWEWQQLRKAKKVAIQVSQVKYSWQKFLFLINSQQ